MNWPYQIPKGTKAFCQSENMRMKGDAALGQ